MDSRYASKDALENLTYVGMSRLVKRDVQARGLERLIFFAII